MHLIYHIIVFIKLSRIQKQLKQLCDRLKYMQECMSINILILHIIQYGSLFQLYTGVIWAKLLVKKYLPLCICENSL